MTSLCELNDFGEQHSIEESMNLVILASW